jgi:nucleoside phosphorylase
MRQLPPKSYSVAVICPLSFELAAMRAMLDETHESPNIALANYTFGRLGKHNVVLTSLPEGSQGTVSAANVASAMRNSFDWIRLRLLVGIGGGVPSKDDVRLGDVVIATPSGTTGGVVEYDLGKRTESGFHRKGFLQSPSPSHLQEVAKLKSTYELTGKTQIPEFISKALEEFPPLQEKFNRPPAETDILFESDFPHNKEETDSCERCDRTKLVQRSERKKPNEPKLHYGLIGSGNSVIKNARERDLLAQEGVLCFEMEAAGLMENYRCLVVRGIADYADSHKNDIWQRYAAVAAAAWAKEYLLQMSPMSGKLPVRKNQQEAKRSR